MPERKIPVLIDSSPEKAEGYVPLEASNGEPTTKVRRLNASNFKNLNKNSKLREEIEQEYGTIDTAEWMRLCKLMKLQDRLKRGDWSPEYSSDFMEKVGPFSRLVADIFGSKSATAYQDKSGLGFQIASDDGKESLTLSVDEVPNTGADEESYGLILEETYKGQFGPVTSRTPITQFREPVEFRFELRPNVKTKLIAHLPLNEDLEKAEFALSKAFTAGMSKVRYVVWWSELVKKLIPGLYCPDIMTALYALAMWSSGTDGGLAVCWKCNEPYSRRRDEQNYCTENCRAAAAMQRRRARLKSKSKV
jgi:hypothetical protein